MNSFWLQFAVTEAATVATAFLQISSLNPQQKADLEALIAAAQKVALDF